MRILACLLALICLTANAAPVHEQARKSALFLQFTDGGCSGTAVAPHVFLSAAHCFETGNLVAVNGQHAKALRVVTDGRDHVLVLTDATFHTFAKYGKAVRDGDPIFVIGNPRTLRGVLRLGYIAKADPKELLVDCNIYYGDSGSAIFNERGEVVGVVSAIIGEPGFKLALALPLAFK